MHILLRSTNVFLNQFRFIIWQVQDKVGFQFLNIIIKSHSIVSFSPDATQPIVGVYFTVLYRALVSSRTRLLYHIQRRTTVGRTPLNERSVRRRDLYLTTHNTHNRQTSKPRVGFEPTIAADERPQTQTLYRAATGTGLSYPQHAESHRIQL